MAQAILMPKLGQTVEEASIVKWLKQEGDTVKKGDVLFEIETDKAVLEGESFYDGVLLKILVRENEMVPVSSPVAYIGSKGETVPDKVEPVAPAAAPPVPEPTPPAKAEKPDAVTPPTPPAAAPMAPVATPVQAAPAVSSAAAPAAQRLRISPRANALAKAKVIDPAAIAGSGPNGRIVERDVLDYLAARGYDALRISPAAKRLAALEQVDILTVKGSGDGGRIMLRDVERAVAMKPQTMSKMRQIIARRLTESFTGTPHFFVTVSVDMTDLLTFRAELKQKGSDFKVTDFILEAVVLSLQEFPVMNSVTDGTTVRWHGGVDLGVAVGLESGLVVPVIRDAGDISLAELHEQAQTMARKARDGKLLPDEMTGSTFTVSNMGMLGVDEFTAIINPGEAAILAVASTKAQPAVHQGEVKIRSMMKMTLSSDHRIVDGTLAANFINAIKTKLEDVELWKNLTS